MTEFMASEAHGEGSSNGFRPGSRQLQEAGLCYNLKKPSPRDLLPPARPHLLTGPTAF